MDTLFERFTQHLIQESNALMLANGIDPTTHSIRGIGSTYFKNPDFENGRMTIRYMIILNNDPLKEQKLANYDQYCSKFYF